MPPPLPEPAPEPTDTSSAPRWGRAKWQNLHLLESEPERLRSELWLRFFQRVLTNRLRQSFNSIRLARPGAPMVSPSLPLIVYCNHPSWWDAALVPILVGWLFPKRKAFAPIDVDALSRYGFMRRLGLFGVQPGSYAGAATFLRVGRQLLARQDTVFCVTPQGRFADPRARPLKLQPGLAGLISVTPQVTVLPLAVEYPFWSERTPEALTCFGEPQVMGSAVTDSLVDIQRTLDAGLGTAMERLALDAISRDPTRFQTVLDGSNGIGGVYDAWRHLKAWRHGERFDPAHARQDEG